MFLGILFSCHCYCLTDAFCSLTMSQYCFEMAFYWISQRYYMHQCFLIDGSISIKVTFGVLCFAQFILLKNKNKCPLCNCYNKHYIFWLFLCNDYLCPFVWHFVLWCDKHKTTETYTYFKISFKKRVKFGIRGVTIISPLRWVQFQTVL